VRGNTYENENAGADDRSHSEARELDGAEDAPKAILATEFFEQDLMRLGCE
jgi:hypothetical protein